MLSKIRIKQNIIKSALQGKILSRLYFAGIPFKLNELPRFELLVKEIYKMFVQCGENTSMDYCVDKMMDMLRPRMDKGFIKTFSSGNVLIFKSQAVGNIQGNSNLIILDDLDNRKPSKQKKRNWKSKTIWDRVNNNLI